MLPASLFVSDKVHAIPVKLPNGEEHVLHFRELPQKVFRKFWDDGKAQSEDAHEIASARLISEAMCNEDGTAALTFEEACTLKPAADTQILKAVMSANDFKEGNS